MRLAIDHSLTLHLADGVTSAVLHLLLTPPDGVSQSVESWSVEVAGIGNASRFSDGFGNVVHLINQGRPEGRIVVMARGVVSTTDTHGVLGKPAGEPVPALYRRVTPLTRAPVTLYGKFRSGRDNRLDVLHGLMARVGETLGLPPEDGAPQQQSQMQATGEQSQSQSRGDVDIAPLPPPGDYAHLFIGAARALEIPARYVVGYCRGEDGVAGGLHAWAEAYDEGLGWIGFDAARQRCPTEYYVRLAVGLDAEGAVPLRAVPAGDIEQLAKVSLVKD